MRALIVPLLCGCASLPAAPARAIDDPRFTPPVAVKSPGVDRDPAPAETLLPGDVVTVHVTTLNTTDFAGLVVNASGTLHVPLVGDVSVGGRRLVDAEAAIQGEVRRTERFARVSLTVTDPAGHRASIVGAVERPAIVLIRPGMRLADLLASAGGAKQVATEDGEIVVLADLEGARLVRDGLAIPVSVRKAMAGDPRHNVYVYAQDLLFVPPLQGQRVSVLGLVHHAKSMPFHEGLRLSQALAMAGGPTKDADNGDIRLIRGPLSSPRVYQASLSALVAGRTHDVALEPGDVLFVTEHWFASVGDVIARLAPLIAAGWIAQAFAR